MTTHWQWPCPTLPSSTELEVSTYQVTIMWPPCDVHVLLLECSEQCTFNIRQLKSCIQSSSVVQIFISYPISYFRFLKAVLLVLSTCLRLHQLADMALHQEIFSLVASQLVRNTSTTNMYMYLHVDIHVAELPKNAADIEESITDVAPTDRGTTV